MSAGNGSGRPAKPFSGLEVPEGRVEFESAPEVIPGVFRVPPSIVVPEPPSGPAPASSGEASEHGLTPADTGRTTAVVEAEIEARMVELRKRLRPPIFSPEERSSRRRRAWKALAGHWRSKALRMAELLDAIADDLDCSDDKANCLSCDLHRAAAAARRPPR
jgi:hypothetical protein